MTATPKKMKVVERSPTCELEDEMLDGAADERQQNSRLSCQLTLTAELGDISVIMPEHQE